MADIIHLLPDSVANQIAAGEVIQRPASVIKELVENSVDAGATEIRIIIKDAGRTLIQVIDNGKGMSETDARMAFERHATSKITVADDLFTLRTMGFRGEALPSVCAISQIELRTRVEGESMGTLLKISGSVVEVQEPCVCEKGTSISVRNIFFNVPARRKFLKSDNVELANVMREFERLALVNNNVRLSIDTGGRVLDLRAASFKQRINDIWKNSLNMQLLPVEVDTDIVKISGFVSRPEFARRRNPLQFLIANGRNMRHPYFHKAVLSCFESLVAPGTQPCYFLKFTVDPSQIDVNIHPTKNEIKFEYEQQIWPILVAAVRSSLGRFAAVPSIDFESDVVPACPVDDPQARKAPELGVASDYSPFRHTQPSSFRPEKVDRNWESLYAGFMNQTPPDASGHFRAGSSDDSGAASGAVSGADSGKDDFRSFVAGRQLSAFPEEEARSVPDVTCLQFALKYIVTVTGSGVLVIDQHRAHIKVLYERLLTSLSRQDILAQPVMFPESVTLSAAQQNALVAVGEDLERTGFRLEHEDDDRWKIMSVPSVLTGSSARDLLLRILDSVCEDSVNYGVDAMPADDVLHKTAYVMARSMAIVRGRRLSGEEMEKLVAGLFSLPDPSLTPSGKRIYTVITEKQLRSFLSF